MYPANSTATSTCNSNQPPSNNTPKKQSKKRAKNRIKYWSLPTVSSGTFDPRLLTERQQLAYLAQKSRGVGDDALEVSPLRLDRLKLEEKRMMSLMGSTNSPLNPTTKRKESAEVNEAANNNKKAKSKQSSSSEMTTTTITAMTNTTNAMTATSPQASTPQKSTTRRSRQQQPSQLQLQLQSSPLAGNSPSLKGRRQDSNTAKNSLRLEETLLLSEMMTIVAAEDSKDAHVKVQGAAIESTKAVIAISSETESIQACQDLKDSKASGFPSAALQSFLQFTQNVRSKHLTALLEAITVRTGLSPEEAARKRQEIEVQYQLNQLEY